MWVDLLCFVCRPPPPPKNIKPQTATIGGHGHGTHGTHASQIAENQPLLSAHQMQIIGTGTLTKKNTALNAKQHNQNTMEELRVWHKKVIKSEKKVNEKCSVQIKIKKLYILILYIFTQNDNDCLNLHYLLIDSKVLFILLINII